MNIDLLSKMVKELLLDNDNVTLPGLGTFIAELSPSTFSDKGYTINPPYRKLYFRQHTGQDELIAELYASSNGLDMDVARNIITDFVAELKAILDKQKMMVFPDLGRLRATKENNYFFVADEELDIYPEGFGLEPISLKTLNFESKPIEPKLVEPKPAEPKLVATESAETKPAETEEIETPAIKKTNSATTKKILSILLILIGVAAVALGLFLLLAHIAPDFIDLFLYNDAELEILRYDYGE